MKTRIIAKLTCIALLFLIAQGAQMASGDQADEREVMAQLKQWQAKPDPDVQAFKEFIGKAILEPAAEGKVSDRVAVTTMQTAHKVLRDPELSDSLAISLLQRGVGLNAYSRAMFGLFIHLPAHREPVENAPQAEELRQARDDRAKLLLSIWKEAVEAREQIPDPDEGPSLNIAPRGGPFAGVSPDAIEDPELRAEYEKRLAEDRAIGRAAAMRAGLKQMQDRYRIQVAPRIVTAYSATGDLQRLNEIVESLDLPEDIRGALEKSSP